MKKASDIFSKEDLKGISEYMRSFYGKNKGIYKEFFNNKLTLEIIDEYRDEFIELYNRLMIEKGYDEMDSFDTPHREFYRDWLLFTVFHKELINLEYPELVKDLRKIQRSDYITLGEFTIIKNLKK